MNPALSGWKKGNRPTERAIFAVRSWVSNLDHQLALLILIFTLPLSLKALQSFFTFDDLMNLHYYVQRPWSSVLANLIVFTSLHRPLGALLYLPLYATVGMVPWPYYLIGILFFSANVLLTFELIRRLTRSRFVTVLATTLFALHPMIHNVLYNFGAVYELTSLTFLLSSTILFIRWSDGSGAGLGSVGEPGIPAFREPTPEAHLRRVRRRNYALSLLLFVAALNAKETAVTLPGILFCFLWLYGPRGADRRQRVWMSLRPVLPFLLIAVPYTLAKTMGAEAYWRSNPLYVYHFDSTISSNLAGYLGFVTNREISFSPAMCGLVLGLVLLTGVLLKNRALLFGLGWAGLTLLPVLPLPRLWELFLYLPLVGFSLSTSALIFDLGRRCLRPFPLSKLLAKPPGRWLTLVLTALFLLRILGAMSPDIDHARRLLYQERNPAWRPFTHQLYQLYPNLPPGSVLAFEAPPFNPKNEERWCLHFLVRLRYGDGVRVLRLPEDQRKLKDTVRRGVRVHLLRWDGTNLLVEE